MDSRPHFTSVEICAGAGGQALGLERAGFGHLGAFELDEWAFQTLSANRPEWNPVLADVREVQGTRFRGVDLFAGGVPCPPFSVAGKQLGPDDDRDLFPAALEWIHEARPKAVLLENVPGLASAKFEPYRKQLFAKLRKLGFALVRGLDVNASNFGVCQLRPRFLVIALRAPFADFFVPPEASPCGTTVGQVLHDLMAARGWAGAARWARGAGRIAPTLVGGSKLHGGPDLGPTRAKAAWRDLGVDGTGLADLAPSAEHPIGHMPKLTVRMTARLQGFPDEWQFAGKKTAQYRQVGNAFPPPVAHAVGMSLRAALERQRAGKRQEAELFEAAVG
jgi:DNA (cytosine-5)-methyltransferase 1